MLHNDAPVAPATKAHPISTPVTLMATPACNDSAAPLMVDPWL